MEHEGLTATQDAHQEKKRKRDDSGNEKGHDSCGREHSLALSQTRALKLERSIFGFAEVEGVLRKISDFMYQYATDTQIEIEAKFGILIDKRTQQRLSLPISCETEVVNYPMRFQSSVTAEIFQLWNQRLNQRYLHAKQPNYQGKKVSYEHFTQIDCFFADGTRVSLDEQRREKHALRKQRIADLNIYSPDSLVDFRVSASREQHVAVPPPHVRPTHERKKERISYKFEIFSFDLTKVAMVGRGNNEETSFEMEIEVADTGLLVAERQKLELKQPNNFLTVAQGLLNNIHALGTVANSLRHHHHHHHKPSSSSYGQQ